MVKGFYKPLCLFYQLTAKIEWYVEDTLDKQSGLSKVWNYEHNTLHTSLKLTVKGFRRFYTEDGNVRILNMKDLKTFGSNSV